MFFSRWKYLCRVYFVSPCTSIISTSEYECRPPRILNRFLLYFFGQVNMVLAHPSLIVNMDMTVINIELLNSEQVSYQGLRATILAIKVGTLDTPRFPKSVFQLDNIRHAVCSLRSQQRNIEW